MIILISPNNVNMRTAAIVLIKLPKSVSTLTCIIQIQSLINGNLCQKIQPYQAINHGKKTVFTALIDFSIFLISNMKREFDRLLRFYYCHCHADISLSMCSQKDWKINTYRPSLFQSKILPKQKTQLVKETHFRVVSVWTMQHVDRCPISCNSIWQNNRTDLQKTQRTNAAPLRDRTQHNSNMKMFCRLNCFVCFSPAETAPCLSNNTTSRCEVLLLSPSWSLMSLSQRSHASDAEFLLVKTKS